MHSPALFTDGPKWRQPTEWQPPTLHSADRRQHTVLVVDDDLVKRYAIVRALTAAGFTVGESDNADGAVALLPAYRAVVLDVHFPDVDGFELCRRVRAAAPHLPIVQVSSVMVEPAYRIAGRAAGADAYLPDPSMDELVRTLDGLLARTPPS